MSKALAQMTVDEAIAHVTRKVPECVGYPLPSPLVNADAVVQHIWIEATFFRAAWAWLAAQQTACFDKVREYQRLKRDAGQSTHNAPLSPGEWTRVFLGPDGCGGWLVSWQRFGQEIREGVEISGEITLKCEVKALCAAVLLAAGQKLPEAAMTRP